MKTADLKFVELCNEVDDWKEAANYWKEKCEAVEKKYTRILDESIAHSQVMTGNQLKLLLSADMDKVHEQFSEGGNLENE
jgi:hypothetical protein